MERKAHGRLRLELAFREKTGLLVGDEAVERSRGWVAAKQAVGQAPFLVNEVG